MLPTLNPSVIILISSSIALLAVHFNFFKVLRFALKKKIVDNPNARKHQKAPIPVMGGLTVSIGFFAGLFTYLAMNRYCGQPIDPLLLFLVLGIILFLIIGMLDDGIGLSPLSRFLIEAVTILVIIIGTGSCIDSFYGLWGIGTYSWWIAIPLTLFITVGIINAINMIDGVNGLSTSLCILFCLLFGTTFLKSGNYSNASANFIMASSLIPFLVHNVIGMRSKMFIGDAGTMMMGLLMSWDVMQVFSSHPDATHLTRVVPDLSLVAFVLSILALPVFDTVRVMLMRIMRHRSPFSADRTHLHHALMNYSMSHSITTFLEVFAALLVFLSCYVTYLLGGSLECQLYVVILSAVILVWGPYAYYLRRNKHQFGVARRLRKHFVALRQGEKPWWRKLQHFVDGK